MRYASRMAHPLRWLKRKLWLDYDADGKPWAPKRNHSRPLRNGVLVLLRFWRQHWINLIQIAISAATVALLYLQLKRM